MKLLQLRKKAMRKGFLVFNLEENEYLVTNLSRKNLVEEKFDSVEKAEVFLNSIQV